MDLLYLPIGTIYWWTTLKGASPSWMNSPQVLLVSQAMNSHEQIFWVDVIPTLYTVAFFQWFAWFCDPKSSGIFSPSSNNYDGRWLLNTIRTRLVINRLRAHIGWCHILVKAWLQTSKDCWQHLPIDNQESCCSLPFRGSTNTSLQSSQKVKVSFLILVTSSSINKKVGAILKPIQAKCCQINNRFLFFVFSRIMRKDVHDSDGHHK